MAPVIPSVIYLQVAHADNDDVDLYKFASRKEAIEFIDINECEEWLMSDRALVPNEPEDYTFVDNSQE